MWVCAMVCLDGSHERLVLSLHCVDHRRRIQVVRLRGGHFCLVGHPVAQAGLHLHVQLEGDLELPGPSAREETDLLCAVTSYRQERDVIPGLDVGCPIGAVGDSFAGTRFGPAVCALLRALDSKASQSCLEAMWALGRVGKGWGSGRTEEAK